MMVRSHTHHMHQDPLQGLGQHHHVHHHSDHLAAVPRHEYDAHADAFENSMSSFSGYFWGYEETSREPAATLHHHPHHHHSSASHNVYNSSSAVPLSKKNKKHSNSSSKTTTVPAAPPASSSYNNTNYNYQYGSDHDAVAAAQEKAKKRTRFPSLGRPPQWLRRTLEPLRRGLKKSKSKRRDASSSLSPLVSTDGPNCMNSGGMTRAEATAAGLECDTLAPPECQYREALQKKLHDPVHDDLLVYLELLAEEADTGDCTSSEADDTNSGFRTCASARGSSPAVSPSEAHLGTSCDTASTRFYRSRAAVTLQKALDDLDAASTTNTGAGSHCPAAAASSSSGPAAAAGAGSDDPYLRLLVARRMVLRRVRVLHALNQNLKEVYEEEQRSRVRRSTDSGGSFLVVAKSMDSNSSWGCTPESFSLSAASATRRQSSSFSARMSPTPQQRECAYNTLMFWSTRINLCRVFEDIFLNAVRILRSVPVFARQEPTPLLTATARQLFLQSERVVQSQGHHVTTMEAMLQHVWNAHRHLREEIQQYELLERRRLMDVLETSGCDVAEFACSTLLCGMPAAPRKRASFAAGAGSRTAAASPSVDELLQQLGYSLNTLVDAYHHASSEDDEETELLTARCLDDDDDDDNGDNGDGAGSRQSRIKCVVSSPHLMQSGTLAERHVTFLLEGQGEEEDVVSSDISLPQFSIPPMTTLLHKVDTHCGHDDVSGLTAALQSLHTIGEENAVKIAQQLRYPHLASAKNECDDDGDHQDDQGKRKQKHSHHKKKKQRDGGQHGGSVDSQEEDFDFVSHKKGSKKRQMQCTKPCVVM